MNKAKVNQFADSLDEQERKHWEQYETDPVYRAKSDIEQAEFNAANANGEANEAMARNKAGRYTLDEAVTRIANNSNATAKALLEKINKSVVAGNLITYRPNSGDEYVPKNNVQSWYCEAYWNDLNDWLLLNKMQLVKEYPNCTFPNPDTPAAKVEDATTPIRQRQDALAVELNEILVSMKTRTPAKVMVELLKQIGKPHTCILRIVGDGIEWENHNGDVKNLTIGKLGERIREWKKTGLSPV
jgi:hypothetical protein